MRPSASPPDLSTTSLLGFGRLSGTGLAVREMTHCKGKPRVELSSACFCEAEFPLQIAFWSGLFGATRQLIFNAGAAEAP